MSLAYNARSREEVDSVLAQAEAAQATILKPARYASWGGYSGYFSDLDGFLWEVAWNPYFPIAPDGSIRLPRLTGRSCWPGPPFQSISVKVSTAVLRRSESPQGHSQISREHRAEGRAPRRLRAETPRQWQS